MRLIDLFSGIGGFSLAASWVWDDLEIVGFCEQDKWCQKILNKHWPDVPIFEDIKELTYESITNTEKMLAKWGEYVKGSSGKHYQKETRNHLICNSGTSTKVSTTTSTEIEPIDLITGGFPCQPYSVAGKQEGEKDDRALWPEMFRVIQEVRPRWVIGENVGGFVRMGLDKSLADLESIGYTCEAIVIPACAVGAWHRRDRCWIVAHSEGVYAQRQQNGQGKMQSWGSCPQPLTDTEEQGSQGYGGEYKSIQTQTARHTTCCDSKKEIGKFRQSESRLGLLVDGLSERLGQFEQEPDIPRVATGVKDRVNKLKGLGNAIVPQVAQVIMQAIKQIEEES